MSHNAGSPEISDNKTIITYFLPNSHQVHKLNTLLLIWFVPSLSRIAQFIIPETAMRVFLPAWAVSAMSQPVSSLAFLTDGVHWGTGDYRFLRNAMIAAAFVGFGGIWLLDLLEADSLYWVWIVVGIWVSVRALFGVLRIWPGIGNSIFRETEAMTVVPDPN